MHETDICARDQAGQLVKITTMRLNLRTTPNGQQAEYAGRWYPLLGTEFGRQIILDDRRSQNG